MGAEAVLDQSLQHCPQLALRRHPGIPHTAYSAAKFAVKGFTEALLEDFRLNTPHVHASVVMPGHIGTEIVNNSRIVHGGDAEPGEEEMADLRAGMKQHGVPVDTMDDDAIRSMMKMFGDMFHDDAPVSAAEAATVILDGVHENRWRILIGDDAREARRSRPRQPGARLRRRASRSAISAPGG